ncbi:MAG: TonB-dependent receptor [Burkholderiaceae bacterium]|nr:TonB-dependent receptor [Burkholderiaceae bacterium]
MKIFSSPVHLAALPMALAAAFSTFPATSAFAQTQLKETVVTASRTQTRADDLVSEVVVLDRAAIEASTGRTLTEVLTRSAGVQMTSNGGLGKNTGVFIRGTEARHTILLIDGVRFGSATAGTPSWDNIPLDMVERIEVLKGPASALYGSEAVGGVVQVFLRKGVKGFSPYASATLGSNSYAQVTAGLLGGDGPLSYAIGVQKTRDKGFSATNSTAAFGNYNPDRDGFKQDAVNASVAYQLNTDWKIDAGLLYADGVNQFDDGPTGDSRAAVRTQTLRAGVVGEILPNWKSQLRVSQAADKYNAIEAAFLPSQFNTAQNQLTWQNDVDTPLGIAVVGLERLTQKVDSSTTYDVTQRTVSSYFAGLNGASGSHSWQANLRRDSNSQFGDSNTWFAGYGYKINPAWRVNASYGTSFVAPSFNQLYYPGFGNTQLQPEKGRNLDLGVTYSENGQTVKLVHFDNKIRGFITGATKAENIPRARIDGWTLGYDGAFGAFNLHASADALNPRNELTDKLLPRRARNQVTLGADYTTGAWTVGGSLLNVGARYDDVKNAVALNSYTTLDVFANYAISKDLQLQTRVNNLTNKSYETAFGFNQPGRAVFVTLRYAMK